MNQTALVNLIKAAEALGDAVADDTTSHCVADPCPVCTAATRLQLAIIDAKEAIVTYEDFLLAFVNNKPPQGWRRGQHAFNLLHDMHPELANKVRGSALDPFYKDHRITVFLQFVQENW